MENATRYRFRTKVVGLEDELQARSQRHGADGSAGWRRRGYHAGSHRAGGEWLFTRSRERSYPGVDANHGGDDEVGSSQGR